MNAPQITRRDFTAGLGGIVLSFSMGPQLALGQDKPKLPGSLQTSTGCSMRGCASTPTAPSRPIPARSSWGRASSPRFAQIAAEELDLSYEKVTLISGDTNTVPNEGRTNGSFSIENSGTALRLASARKPARSCSTSPPSGSGSAADTLRVADGVITAADGRKVSYSELASSVDLKREATA